MAKKDKEEDEFRPTGTIAVLTVFVITLIAIISFATDSLPQTGVAIALPVAAAAETDDRA